MAVFDTRGMLRRCPACDSAVAEDAAQCGSCGAALGEDPGEDAGAQRPKVSGAVFGSAGLFGLGAGTSGFASGVSSFFRGLFQSLGEAGVKLLGLKTGPAALDENPWAGGEAIGAGALIRRRFYRLTFTWRTGLRETSLIDFYRSLASYSEAGVGFHDALSRIEKNELSPAMKRVIREIRTDLLDGATLGQAFGKHEYLFDSLHVALIEVGESLGTISENMKMLVEIIIEKQAIKDQLAKKAVQPVTLIFLANYVMTIPILMTKGIFGYIAAIIPPTLFFAFAIFCFVIVFPVLGAAMGARLRDRVVLELPAFGTIARTSALSRFARALGAAIGAGVNMEKSLRMAARASGNVVVEDAVIAALPFVKERGLAPGLERGGILPPEIAAVLAHGEQSGKLAPTLQQIAKDAAAKAARGIAILGGIFSFLVLAVTAIYAVLKSMTTVLSMIGGDGGGLRPGFKGFDPFNDPRLPKRR